MDLFLGIELRLDQLVELDCEALRTTLLVQQAITIIWENEDKDRFS